MLFLILSGCCQLYNVHDINEPCYLLIEISDYIDDHFVTLCRRAIGYNRDSFSPFDRYLETCLMMLMEGLAVSIKCHFMPLRICNHIDHAFPQIILPSIA